MIKILTQFYKTLNYGGILQSYALCAALRKYNLNSEQISFKMQVPSVHLSTCKRIFSLSIRLFFFKIFIKLMSVAVRLKLIKRADAFLSFSQLWVPHDNQVFDAKTIANLIISSSDIFIAGSDQVWNPFGTEDAYFFNFVPSRNVKIAYAASIGTNSVSQAYLEHVVPLLNRFDFISVREESAKEILQPHVDKPIKVVLDPTLLLTHDEWDKIAVQPAVPQPYIFVYMLGEKREHRRLIKKYAKTLGLKIVFLPHVHFRFNPADCFFADYNLYDVGPREFVGLIKNAEMVITDSFHGCVFSIIYQKKFWALKRHKDSEKENMNSRLYTLFDSLGLRDRLIDDESAEYDAKSLNRQIDYSQVEANLDALRKDSSDFLLNAIKSVQQRMKDEARDTQ